MKILEKEKIGTITLGNRVRVSDPCYDLDTWCGSTIDNVLEGEYNCYSQSVDFGENWSINIAGIEVRHKDFDDVAPLDLTDIYVYVDSGQAGIYDLDYFADTGADKRADDEWYGRVCDHTIEYTENPEYIPFDKSKWWKDEFLNVQDMLNGSELFDEYNSAISHYYHSKNASRIAARHTSAILDEKCIVSSSGDGDGAYRCLVGRNEDGKIVSIKIDYYDRANWDTED